MKYYVIYESDLNEEEIVKLIRKKVKKSDDLMIMYIGVIEDEEMIEDFIDEQRIDYELRKRRH